MRLTDKLLNLPPIACRLLARRVVSGSHVVPLTDAEIAERSGLSMAEVKALSWQAKADDRMFRFARACGVDYESRREVQKAKRLLKKGNFSYLRRSPEWKTLYNPLIVEWRKETRCLTK